MGTAEAITDDFYRLTGKHPKSFSDFVIENIERFNRDQKKRS
ncbi:hypothetical protein [Youngiibacter multivorans]|uniref:Uncharacterized protein n=1 Tax=Youngiibacter multivorans TaxID=937251 RepID=A0ABS4G261_9CLOT|nr:hypothetical protein [Youngiibacter multivorans]MBP1918606.1 hypothetical protein [Youngiibacter multivorans]